LRLSLQSPEAVRRIAERLENSGFETWAVGGAVRDALLGPAAAEREHLPSDWDLATRARPETVRKLFRRTVPIGIDHGTVGVFGSDGILYEVTTFRRDVETTGRHAVIAFADTVDEDLSRRDFTLNAIAWHPIREELRDPYGGFEDLKAGILRTVGSPVDRFAEDYLRILRGLRFAGHFALQVEPATWSALVDATPMLAKLSAERIREELWKILSKTQHASAALKLYAESESLAVLYPELAALVGLDLGEGHKYDAWLETLATVDALPISRPLLRVAALLHKVGMPGARTRDLRGGWRFTGHEVSGARKAEEIMRRLKASNADTERVRALVAKQSDLFPPDAPDAGVRRWLMHIGPNLVNDLFRLRIAMWRANPVAGGMHDLADRWRKAHRILLQHPVLDIGGLAIDGAALKRLGLTPGPQFGTILRKLLDLVVEDPLVNDPEILERIVREELAH